MIQGPSRSDIALNHRTPATYFHQTFLVAKILSEGAFLIEARANATLMDRFAEEPRGAAEFIGVYGGNVRAAGGRPMEA